MLYRKIDTDSSGSVSAEEFLLGFESAGATEQNVQEAISSACNVSIDEALDIEMNIDQFQKAYVNLMSLVSTPGDKGEQQQRHLGRVSDNVSKLFDTLQLNGAVSVEASIRHVLRVMRFDATEDDLCLVAAEVLGADESKVLSKKFCKEEFSGFLGSVQHHFERMKDDPKTVAASSDLAKASSKSKSKKKAGKKIRMLFRKLDTDQAEQLARKNFSMESRNISLNWL